MKNSVTYSKFRISVLLFILCHAAFAQISITTLPYSPGVTTFDTYNPVNKATALATIPQGWSFSSTGAEAFNGQSISGPATGGYWAYTFLLSGDYNLGAQRDATVGDITYHVEFVNNTGGLITSLVLSWDYEQWRFANSSGWSCFGTGALAGNTTLPAKGYIGSSSSFLNTATSTSVPGFTLSGLAIANGASFGISWTTNDDTGADNGVAIDNFSIVAGATPSITIANATIPAGNIYQTSVNNVLYRTDVTLAVSPATLNSAVFTTAGSYLSANLTNLNLWYSQNSTFSAATSTLLSSKTTGLGPGAKTFSGLSQQFPIGTGYLYLTTDVPCNTTLGNAVSVNSISAGSLTFGTGTKSGSVFTSGGVQTLSAITMNAVSSQSICAGKTMGDLNFVTYPPGATVTWSNNNTSAGLAASGTGNITAFTAPAVSTVQTANITTTVSSGTCIGTSSSFNIVVKNNGQSSSMWTGAVSGSWSDSDNWSNCSCTSATDATISAGTNNPVISGAANVRNITINSGAMLSLQSTDAINVKSNWTNNGTFNAQKGSVVFDGSTAQTIGGSSTTSFYDVIVNNPAGASLLSNEQVRGTLYLNSGVFNTNNKLTLTASASESGKIGPISSSADIINNVTIQQYAPAGATGWALLGSPVSTTLDMTSWNDNFPITCLSCPDGYNNFPSIYTYNESMSGNHSDPNKYIPITSIGDPIKNGLGYWVYLGNGTSTTTAINFDVTGPVAKSSCLSCTDVISIPLSVTPNNGPADDGWNLISNPLPSPISWTALRNGNPLVDNAIYVYNADLGMHTSFVNGVSSTTIGGITDNIAISQGFYVHATAATTLAAGEDIKTDSNPALLRSTIVAAKPIVRLEMETAGFNDETVFYFEYGGSKSFQPAFDAYKLVFDPNLPYLGSMSDSILTSISGLPELNTNISVPVKAISPATGSFTFSAQQSDFPDNVCVTLYDAYTGITTNILSSGYVCTLYDTTSSARFTINFFTTPLNAASLVNQASCSTPGSAFIMAKPAGQGPWNYEWRNADSVVKVSLNKTGADSLVNLQGGSYSVKISSVGQCDNFSKDFSVNAVVVPTASFVPDVFATTLSNSGKINFANTSQNALFNIWEFGDNSGTFYMPGASHNYAAAGVYKVTLITESNTHCKDTATQVVKVINDITGIGEIIKNKGIVLASVSHGNYGLLISSDMPEDVSISLFDLTGKLIHSIQLLQVSATKENISLEGLPQGMYLLKTVSGGKEKTFKLLN